MLESTTNGTKEEAIMSGVEPPVDVEPQSLPSAAVASDTPSAPEAGTSASILSTENGKTTTLMERASIDTTRTKQSSSTEGEGFAGDATWEERTWKEVVRLKEEMFWARMGGVRALRG